MKAVKELGFQTIVVYPNADAGSRKMIEIIKRYKKYSFLRIFKNISHENFLGLMKVAKVIVGNSSSGIIEAPSFYLPAVNIGTREKGREKADNVIEAGYNKEQIKRAIKKAVFDKKFREKIKKCKNPYGDGKTGKRVANILARIKIDKRLLQKQISY